MKLNFSVLSAAVLAIAAAFALCSCVGYESSESSSAGQKQEAWYEGAGFFYLDKILFKDDEDMLSTSQKRQNSEGGVRIFRETKNN